MFHLFTHAFFKALLFLGAGSVIHGMHHEQDMRNYGGLWKYLPITYAVMTIGTIAITGLGIPHVFGFAGFYSKDTIIESAFAFGRENGIGNFAGWVGLVVAGLTAYYSWRVAFFTFHGQKRWGEHAAHDAHGADDHASHAQHETHDEPIADAHAHGHDDHGHGHGHDHKPHESPWVMLVPIILLAVGAVFAGVVFAPFFVGHHENDFWQGAIFNAPTNLVLEHAHNSPAWVVWAPLIASGLGLLIAIYLYILKEGTAKRLAEQKGGVYLFLYNKWFFDEAYEFIFVKGARALGDLFWKVGDQKIIDGLGPNGVAWLSGKLGKLTGRLQTGYVYHYAFVMLLGVLGLVSFALWAWG